MEIRPAVIADAESAVALYELVEPYLLSTVGGVRSSISQAGGSRARVSLAAVQDGEVIGWSSAALIAGSDPVSAQLRVLVHPAHRGHGVGTELLDATHAQLKNAGAQSVRVFADPASAAWASRWGYVQTRQVHYAGIEPRLAPALPEVPSAVRLMPLDEVDPRGVYEADEVAQRTKPGDAKITSRPYDDWLAGVWKAPGMVLDLSVAALHGDQVVGFTLGNGDHHKIWSQMTATMPQYRGRGLAKLVKCAALHRAAEAGVVGAYTANYDGNEPMIAVNEWLGYHRTATHSVLVCPL
jgi:GNAT superfamily N-acetyltransferase